MKPPSVILKIAVFADGRFTVDGAPSTLPELRAALERLDKEESGIHYYREAAREAQNATASAVYSELIGAGLPIRLSTRPDFVDAVDGDGVPRVATTEDTLARFEEVQGDVSPLAFELLRQAQAKLRQAGRLTPIGGVRHASGNVRTCEPRSGEDGARTVAGAEVAPAIRAGLRASAANDPSIVAVAVCEDALIEKGNGSASRAVRVIVEHRRGLAIAFYLPYRKRFLRGVAFEEVALQASLPDIDAWPRSDAP